MQPNLCSSTPPHLALDHTPNRSSKMRRNTKVLELQENTLLAPYIMLCMYGHWHAALGNRSRLLKSTWSPDKAKAQCTAAWEMETWARR